MSSLLIIEDDELLRDGLSAKLAQAGHSVTAAARLDADHLGASIVITPREKKPMMRGSGASAISAAASANK